MQTTDVFMMSLVGPFSFFLAQERCIMGTFYRVPHHVLKRGFARHRTTSGDGECWEKGGLANNGGKRWTANKQVGDAFLCRFAWRTPSFTGAVWGRGLVISAVYLTIFDVARQCITSHIKKLKNVRNIIVDESKKLRRFELFAFSDVFRFSRRCGSLMNTFVLVEPELKGWWIGLRLSVVRTYVEILKIHNALIAGKKVCLPSATSWDSTSRPIKLCIVELEDVDFLQMRTGMEGKEWMEKNENVWEIIACPFSLSSFQMIKYVLFSFEASIGSRDGLLEAFHRRKAAEFHPRLYQEKVESPFA